MVVVLILFLAKKSPKRKYTMGLIKNSLYRISSGKFIGLFRNQAIFPYYHIIRNERVAHIENLYPFKNIQQFEKDLDFLLMHYKSLDLQELITHNIPDKSFLLTFDDGLHEIYNIIFPILKRKGIKAIFFINPNCVDNASVLFDHEASILIDHLKHNAVSSDILDRISDICAIHWNSSEDLYNKLKHLPLSKREKLGEVFSLLQIDIDKYGKEYELYVSKSQIQEMVDAGYYFGGHTMSHPPLDQLTIADQKREIIDSVEWVKQTFQLDYSLFAFPYSDRHASHELIEELFKYDPNMLVFGNSGLVKDVDDRIIQRFSLENPQKSGARQIVMENLYKHYRRLTATYKVKRQ